MPPLFGRTIAYASSPPDKKNNFKTYLIMQDKFLHLLYQTQEIAWRLFTEKEQSSSQSANFYTGAHCGTYSRLHTKQENILFH